MTDLKLSGPLNLTGTLKLSAEGGKVRVGGLAALVQVHPQTGPAHGMGVPIIQPPPPAGPIDTGVNVRVFNSFNSTVTVKVMGSDAPVIALGICAQGNTATWPGIVLPSTKNASVTINHVLINVEGDSAILLPNGASVPLNNSGQS